MPLLIILYALSGTIEIPIWCFIAAWIIFAANAILTIANIVLAVKKR